MITKGGGTISLTSLNERKSEIDQGLVLMNALVDQLSTLRVTDIDVITLKTIIGSQKGMKITDAEANTFVARMKELYRVNRVTDATPSEAKAILIK